MIDRPLFTRHLVVSLERGADLPDDQFGMVAQRFMSTFAPSSNWLGAVDRDTKSVHLHIVLANSTGQRTVDFSPSVLTRMNDVAEWSSGILESGRRGAVLDKLTTAKQLVNTSHEQIIQSIQDGTIQVGRCNKRGQVTSIIIGGKHVHLSTVQRPAGSPRRRGRNGSGSLSSRNWHGAWRQSKRTTPSASTTPASSSKSAPVASGTPPRQRAEPPCPNRTRERAITAISCGASP